MCNRSLRETSASKPADVLCDSGNPTRWKKQESFDMRGLGVNEWIDLDDDDDNEMIMIIMMMMAVMSMMMIMIMIIMMMMMMMMKRKITCYIDIHVFLKKMEYHAMYVRLRKLLTRQNNFNSLPIVKTTPSAGAGGQERRVSMRLHRRDAAAGEMQPKTNDTIPTSYCIRLWSLVMVRNQLAGASG
ncbi:hypothetical protein E2986_05799 [Frieseomelitta varia]|uniref:Uncharacterized protein n=1 Tax=Frieseomelitta varia TaxID=561572 RepID=A0A833SAE0_9HYME|nr:hypothetical protein E2986_05799 [Frieseomelitta varia]